MTAFSDDARAYAREYLKAKPQHDATPATSRAQRAMLLARMLSWSNALAEEVAGEIAKEADRAADDLRKEAVHHNHANLPGRCREGCPAWLAAQAGIPTTYAPIEPHAAAPGYRRGAG